MEMVSRNVSTLANMKIKNKHDRKTKNLLIGNIWNTKFWKQHKDYSRLTAERSLGAMDRLLIVETENLNRLEQ